MDYVDILDDYGEVTIAVGGLTIPVDILTGEADDFHGRINIFFNVRSHGHVLRFDCIRDKDGDYYLPRPSDENADEYTFRLDHGRDGEIPKSFLPGLALEEKLEFIERLEQEIVPEFADVSDNCW